MGLTDYEIKVLTLIAQGMSNERIAEVLDIEKPTASSYVYHLRRKLGLPDRDAMTALTSDDIEAYRRASSEPAKENNELTDRQKDIIAYCIVKGQLDEDSAKNLGLTTKAFGINIKNICKALKLGKRVQAAYCIKQGWIPSQEASKKEPAKPIYKSLLAALALSPSNKAIMALSKRYRLIIERHWTPSNLCYSVHLIDMAKRDIAYATGAVPGMAGLEEWMKRIEEKINVSIDLNKKRWLIIEESERNKE